MVVQSHNRFKPNFLWLNRILGKGDFEGLFLVELLGSVDGTLGVAGGKLDIVSGCCRFSLVKHRGF